MIASEWMNGNIPNPNVPNPQQLIVFSLCSDPQEKLYALSHNKINNISNLRKVIDRHRDRQVEYKERKRPEKT